MLNLDNMTVEQWVRCFEPRWQVGRSKRPAQTGWQALEQRRKLISRLRRPRFTCAECSDLADWLELCTSFRPCLSGACAVCTRAAQRWFVANAASVIEQHRCQLGYLPDDGERSHCFVSVIPTECEGNGGKRTFVDDFDKAERLLDEALASSKVRFALGGIDVTYREIPDDDDAYFSECKRSVHAWFAMSIDEFEASKGIFREAFPACDVVPAPIRSELFDGNLATIAGSLNFRHRRHMLPASTFEDDGSWVRKGRPRNVDLLDHQEIYVALTLDRFGLRKRILAVGVTAELFQPMALLTA